MYLLICMAWGIEWSRYVTQCTHSWEAEEAEDVFTQGTIHHGLRVLLQNMTVCNLISLEKMAFHPLGNIKNRIIH